MGMNMRRFRYRLAWVLLWLLLLVTVFGSYLMPHYISPPYKIPFLHEVANGVPQDVSPPFPPSGTFWLGTDNRGYDMLSLLLNGAKYTIGFAVLITLLRFLVAVPLGLYAGVTGRARQTLSTLQLVTSSVPVLLFLFPSMYGLSKVLPPDVTEKILFVMLVLFGIFQVAHQFAKRAEFFSGKLFVTAAQTMGASTWRIVFRHLLPHLRPEMLFAFLTELVQVLFLLGQLAVVGIFLGGGEEFVLDPGSKFSPKVSIFLTTSGEWGGLIAYGIRVILNDPWILLSAGACLAMAILILTFFSKQLQARLEHPALYGTKKPLRQNKPLLSGGGVAVVACLLLVTLAPNKAPTLSTGTSGTSTAISSNVQSANGSSAPGQPDKQTVDAIKNTAQQFLSYVTQNQWNFADPYVRHKQAEQYIYDTQPPGATFARWLKLFSSKQYKLDSIGNVKVIGSPDDGNYEAVLKVTGPSGQPETWKLQLDATQTGSNIVVKVDGGTDGTNNQ